MKKKMDIKTTKTKGITKKCKVCGKSFTTYYSFQKYCSPQCSYESIKNHNRKNRARAQDNNVKKFEKKYGNAKGKLSLTCKNCGKKYDTYASHIRFRGSNFCSVKCRSDYRKKQTPDTSTLDTLWSEIIKLRAGNKCEYCGKTTYLNSHHIFSRSNMSVRWDLENGVCLCAGHHMLSNFSAHKSPLEFAEWLRETRGEEWYTKLRKLAKSVVYSKDMDKRGIKIQLEEEKERLLEKFDTPQNDTPQSWGLGGLA